MLRIHVFTSRYQIFSPKNLVWNYKDKTDILKRFPSEYVKSFIQSSQKKCLFDWMWIYILWKKNKSWKKEYESNLSFPYGH